MEQSIGDQSVTLKEVWIPTMDILAQSIKLGDHHFGQMTVKFS